MRSPFSLDERATGILLHPTSLPGPHGIGDFGAEAYKFVDFLCAAGVRWWQMLPLGPIGPGNSPYSATSAFADNPLLISLHRLAEDGLLRRNDLKTPKALRTDRVSYSAVARFKTARLRSAFDEFMATRGLRSAAFRRFCKAEESWLENHALFSTLRRVHRNRSWTTWPLPQRARRTAEMERIRKHFRQELDFERFCQFHAARQWTALRTYANRRGVGLIGDIPIFVADDSSDVWAHPELFDLDAKGHAKTVSGCPPDMFSKTGQRWGHPQYRWRRHQATGFAWWLARFARTFEQFDAVRIDHFLGFNRVWSVPGTHKTAKHGRWIKTPGRTLFTRLRKQFGRLNIIAEDLGVVTDEALRLREDFGFPGMRLLQFAFGNDDGDRYNQPHSYPRNCVVYPGTHDNDTLVGWWNGLRAEHRRRRARKDITPYQRALRYMDGGDTEIHWKVLRTLMSSVANTAVFPAQDLLGLDSRHRMNTPATMRGNWEWRLPPGRLTARLAAALRDLNEAFERLPG